MEVLTEFINAHVDYAPWIVFGALMLAGFNIPVSEDALIIISALIATKNPERIYELFLAVFAGAYLSDLVCYSLGRYFGPKLANMRWFSSMIDRKKIDAVTNYYARYGVITLFFGRFIPFGVRNALFLTAGFGKMNFLKFALADMAACLISNTTLFTLVYLYGKSVIAYLEESKYVIFSLAVIVVSYILIRKKFCKKK